MKLPIVFNPNRRNHRNHEGEEEKGKSGGGGMNPKQSPHRVPKLERRNAAKNIDYAVDDGSSVHDLRLRSRSLDQQLPLLYNTKTSFRIDGEYEGEVDVICRNLGLAGPEDFAIPAAAWEARKERSSSDLLPSSRLLYADKDEMDVESYMVSDGGGGGGREGAVEPEPSVGEEVGFSKYGRKEEEEEGKRGSLSERFSSSVRVRDVEPDLPSKMEQVSFRTSAEQTAGGGGAGGGGIKGPRPPVLKPPPAAMALRVIDKQSTTWDLLRSLAGDDGDEDKGVLERKSTRWEDDKEAEVGDNVVVAEEIDVEYGVARMAVTTNEEFTGSSSFTTSNEDDSPNTAVEGMYEVHGNSGFNRNITGWIQGKELGRGSFGTVYEAISDNGFFFAVKEVSLLDQGSNAQQCIQQLEQEIALLRNFKHENIVQYLGTKKEEAKLFIFLELVTQGSLAYLYQKYHLRDSQVSVYTWQILNGLKYLHDRNVVHRDIKCGNILVDASGSVKLADFGLAKETSKLTGLKSCKGSVYWMAPEVVKPRRSYGPAADIWSLGCTVLEMLTRKVPYPDLEWTQALFKIGRGEKPDIPESLSKEAHDFVKQCTQVEPDDRPTASELLDHPFVKRNLSSAGSNSDYSSRGRRT